MHARSQRLNERHAGIFYTGAFPVYTNNDSVTGDDMGVVAIKNHILFSLLCQ